MDEDLKKCGVSRTEDKPGGGGSARRARLEEMLLKHKSWLADGSGERADLSSLYGLTSNELAGLDLTGVLMPDSLQLVERFKYVEAASKNAQKLFFIMLSAVLYCGLTVVITSDFALLSNTASSKLPFFQSDIPIFGFFWAAPLLLFGLYLYFHIYLSRLWEALAVLPAYLPDGRALDEAAYPWLLNGLICFHSCSLKARGLPYCFTQVVVSTVLAWMLVPITMLIFWQSHLVRHNMLITGLHIFLFALSVSMGLSYYRHAARTLAQRRIPADSRWTWQEPLKQMGRSLRSPEAAVFLIGAGLLALISYHCITKPAWMGVPHLSRVKSDKAVLSELDLRGADLRRADLHGGNFESSDLTGATLKGAILTKANFGSANLRAADLVHSIMREASFIYADLQGADLFQASLQKANFLGAHLQGADLFKADLRGANFTLAALDGVNLSSAILTDADLREDQLCMAQLDAGTIMMDGKKLKDSRYKLKECRAEEPTPKAPSDISLF